MRKAIKQANGVNLALTAMAVTGLLFAGAAGAMGPTHEKVLSPELQRQESQQPADDMQYIGGRVGRIGPVDTEVSASAAAFDERFVGGRVGHVPLDNTSE